VRRMEWQEKVYDGGMEEASMNCYILHMPMELNRIIAFAFAHGCIKDNIIIFVFIGKVVCIFSFQELSSHICSFLLY
jgi:hypothetical protein